jgi:cyclic pyranopterin phosphate synthase
MSAVLPIVDAASLPELPEERLHDGHGRVITDLRLSVTDRCNYRCV